MKLVRTTALVIAASLAFAPVAFAQSAPATAPAAPAAPKVTAPAVPSAPAAPAAPKAAAPAATTAPAAQNKSTLVNLNTATAAELDGLPQIGEARSKAIIAKRPYKNWEDFVAKNVVPANAEAAIKDKVRF